MRRTLHLPALTHPSRWGRHSVSRGLGQTRHVQGPGADMACAGAWGRANAGCPLVGRACASRPPAAPSPTLPGLVGVSSREDSDPPAVPVSSGAMRAAAPARAGAAGEAPARTSPSGRGLRTAALMTARPPPRQSQTRACRQRENGGGSGAGGPGTEHTLTAIKTALACAESASHLPGMENTERKTLTERGKKKKNPFWEPGHLF